MLLVLIELRVQRPEESSESGNGDDRRQVIVTPWKTVVSQRSERTNSSGTRQHFMGRIIAAHQTLANKGQERALSRRQGTGYRSLGKSLEIKWQPSSNFAPFHVDCHRSSAAPSRFYNHLFKLLHEITFGCGTQGEEEIVCRVELAKEECLRSPLETLTLGTSQSRRVSWSGTESTCVEVYRSRLCCWLLLL